MKVTGIRSSAVAVAIAMGVSLSAVAVEKDRATFSALQGLDAQALSVDEMQAISGELNAYDIAAELTEQAAKLGKYPKLQAAALKLAHYYLNNAVKINQAFDKFGVLTACKTCP
jgi:hypothetical protein